MYLVIVYVITGEKERDERIYEELFDYHVYSILSQLVIKKIKKAKLLIWFLFLCNLFKLIPILL